MKSCIVRHLPQFMVQGTLGNAGSFLSGSQAQNVELLLDEAAERGDSAEAAGTSKLLVLTRGSHEDSAGLGFRG